MKINTSRRRLIKIALASSMAGSFYSQNIFANTQQAAECSLAMKAKIEDAFQNVERNESLSDDILITSADDKNGNHFLIRYHTVTGELSKWPIAIRGHGSQVTFDKDFALTISRRPGTSAYIQSLCFNDKPFQFTTTKNRHFYGHAVYADNGRYLLTTENDYINDRSVIGVRDAFDDYKWIGEIDASGIGGHELAILNDGKTLVVANGGIITHPDQPRKKLNLDAMQSSLVYLDIGSGDILDEYFLDDPQMSIRHLDVSANNEVVIACQHQAKDDVMMPMMYFHQGQNTLQPAILEDDFYWLSYHNYTSSVSQHESGVVCMSTPRGNKISFWDGERKSLIKEHYFPDVSGVAVSRNNSYFIATSGRGDIRYFHAQTLEENQSLRQKLTGLRFDNHLTVI